MTNLDFNTDRLENMTTKDLISFTKHIFGGYFVQNKELDRIVVGDWTKTECQENENMTTIKVYFQGWKKGESGKGTFFVWETYRAKNFSCSQSNILAKAWSVKTTPELMIKHGLN